jgi:glucose/arabinose dehydrogenase
MISRPVHWRPGVPGAWAAVGLAVLLISALAVLILAVLNVGGWRALVVSRVFRVSNHPSFAPPALGFVPRVPEGFSATLYASGFEDPRWLAVAPSGDLFLADSAAGRIVVLRPPSDGREPERELFVEGLTLPFGIAFSDRHVYVASTDQVARYPYDSRTSKRRGPAESLLALPGGGYNQHWTRSILIDRHGRLFVSVGSKSNIGIEPDPRATILVADVDGRNVRVFARGLRNAVGIGVNPETGLLWATVNERDNLGDDAPDDFFTEVVDGGFYGWPYTYDAGVIDRRVRARPDLAARARRGDVPLGAHVAPLQFAFYDGDQFPDAYRGGAFIARHGSWNRRLRSGYDVVFVPFRNGRPAGAPQVFMEGFVPDRAGSSVYGRPVGVAVLHDGTLLIADDAAKVIWQVAYHGFAGEGGARGLAQHHAEN